MPQKRDEVVQEYDASQMMPNIYENWLKKQRTAGARAKSGYLSQVEEEDRAEDRVDLAEDAHEKAKRRKRGRTGR
jgi:hypothetical protein